MKVKTTVLMVLVLGFAAPGLLEAGQSLGDFARQQRLRRDRHTVKNLREFTNDNLPPPTPWEAVTSVGIETTPAVAEASAPETAQGAATTEPQKTEDKKQTKEYWEAKFQAVQQKLAQAEELQQLSEDELSLLRLQQGREIGSDVQREIGSKIASKLLEVENGRSEVLRARQELDTLEKEFAESGAPKDWHPAKAPSDGQ